MGLIDRFQIPVAAMTAALGFAAAQPAHAAPAPGVTFTKIADTGTIIPAGQWAGEKFKAFGIPSIQGGRVAFSGLADSGNGQQNGMYTWSGGALALLVDPSVPRPGGGPAFDTFRYASAIPEGYGFDTGSTLGRTGGIYRAVNGALQSIGSLQVTHTRGTTFDGPDTWFYGYSFHPPPIGGIIDAGIYRARNGLIENLVPHGTATPSAPQGYVFDFGSVERRVVAGDGRAVFWAVSTRPASQDVSGLYSVKDGIVERIVDSSMTAAGTAAAFGDFAATTTYDYDGATLIFKVGAKIYTAHDGVVSLVMSNGEPAPGGGTFSITQYSEVAVDGTRLAITEGLDPIGPPSNLYLAGGYERQRLIGAGDELSGRIIERIQIGPASLDGCDIVFRARFTDGATGIYVVTVPEPDISTITLVSIAIWTGVIRRKEVRRRRTRPTLRG